MCSILCCCFIDLLETNLITEEQILLDEILTSLKAFYVKTKCTACLVLVKWGLHFMDDFLTLFNDSFFRQFFTENNLTLKIFDIYRYFISDTDNSGHVINLYLLCAKVMHDLRHQSLSLLFCMK